MLTVNTLHAPRANGPRLQITVYTSTVQHGSKQSILLGWIDLGLWDDEPPFTLTLSPIWLEGVSSHRQPCSSFADGLRRFVAIERLIARHGLNKASQLLTACQTMSEKT